MNGGESDNTVPFIPIHHEALGIRQTDQSRHHEVWFHLDFVEKRSGQVKRITKDTKNHDSS